MAISKQASTSSQKQLVFPLDNFRIQLNNDIYTQHEFFDKQEPETQSAQRVVNERLKFIKKGA